MAASLSTPKALRENAPLWGVATILMLAFAWLAWLGPSQQVGSGASASAVPATGQERGQAIELQALPATPDDTIVLSELSPEEARARNELVAMAPVGPGEPRAFDFRGSTADRARAVDCLALAGMAEAGGADADQRAVMQVVLNRVRHPAFAASVCGVVFEGSQRPTGCQFSFTCDGSLVRRYSEAAWAAARRRAEAMLDGAVFPPVGAATHFHADYVYPWWSDRLDKVARVGPHLFFRWRGPWGQARALSVRYAGGEPDPLALRETALAVAEANPLPTLFESGEALRSITSERASRAGSPATQVDGERGPTSPGPGVHFVLVSPNDPPEGLIARARSLCPGERFCQVYGWSEAAAVPTELPLSDAARRALRFSFLPPRAGNAEAIYFDCRLYPAPAEGSCLPQARN